jgi:hypothetical protein
LGVVPVVADGVRVETVELDAGGARQIGARHHTTALSRGRHDEIEAAVEETTMTEIFVLLIKLRT